MGLTCIYKALFRKSLPEVQYSRRLQVATELTNLHHQHEASSGKLSSSYQFTYRKQINDCSSVSVTYDLTFIVSTV
jgi:hypothetical protein